jgi:hypothetical protein
MLDTAVPKSFVQSFWRINGLLTEREVCTVKYQTEVF